MTLKPFKKTLTFYTHTAKIFLCHISNGAKRLFLRGLRLGSFLGKRKFKSPASDAGLLNLLQSLTR